MSSQARGSFYFSLCGTIFLCAEFKLSMIYEYSDAVCIAPPPLFRILELGYGRIGHRNLHFVQLEFLELE